MHSLKHCLVILVATAITSASAVGLAAAEANQSKPLHMSPDPKSYEKASLAYKWLDIMQEVSARDVEAYGARPTVLSRSMAIWATAMFDAWAAYDDKAVGSRLGDKLRQPKSMRTLENQEVAISHAAYHALKFVYPEALGYLNEQMQKMGYDPASGPSNPQTPAGIGYIAAQAVIDYRKQDGSNQFGDEIGSNGKPYSDYTFYRPVNPVDEIIDPDRWQPITFTLSDGRKITPGFLTPHWYRVKPFVLESSDQFRPGPPPTTKSDDKALREQTALVLKYNQQLTDEQKAIVEFMRDGPRSTAQSGHWLRFAQDVSRRDQHTLEQDVKLYFVVANVAFDAFIACWEAKRFYDSSRPWTLVRHYYKGQKIKGWAGKEGGVRLMDASEWHPYSPRQFITPPFPGYTSGHATVSGASAKIIELFTGSDRFGFAERRRHCELTEDEPGDFVTLDLPTWSRVAEIAAFSRALGGYHIPIDNDVGLKMGRDIATWSWSKYQAYFNGSAHIRE